VDDCRDAAKRDTSDLGTEPHGGSLVTNATDELAHESTTRSLPRPKRISGTQRKATVERNETRTPDQLHEELSARHAELMALCDELANALDAVPDAVLVVGFDLRVRRFNAAAARLLGLDRTAAGRRLVEVEGPFETGSLVAIAANAVDDVTTVEIETRSENGRFWRIQARPYKTAERRIEGAVMTFRDTHGLHCLLEDLAASRRAANDKAATYEQRLNEARAALAEAEAAKRCHRDAAALLAHELRGPLTAMAGSARILARALEDVRVPPGTARALETLSRSVGQQCRSIEDVLDVSRIDAGKLAVDRTLLTLPDDVSSAVEAMRPAAEANGVELVFERGAESVRVIGDRVRLEQVVTNLLGNAIKFTPEGGSIRASCFATSSHAVLEVADTGIGIAASLLPHVFDRFRQGDSSRTRATGGLGLGLAIVRHLVEAHGGQVVATSPGVGRGATLRVELPRAPEHAPEPDLPLEPPAPRAAPRSLRILFVDDDADVRAMMSDGLAYLGHETRVAACAEEAMALLERHSFDVVVSDIAMPVEDGLSLMRRIRARQRDGKLIAVAMSGFSAPCDRDRARAAGFDAFVVKPIDQQALADLLAGLVA
jgi:two-component system CheB/CheR fusion protein